MIKRNFGPLLFVAFLVAGCGRKIPEMTLEEIEGYRTSANSKIISETTSKPWHGQDSVPGTVGGTWYTSMAGEPKSFNALIAERDSATNDIVSMMTDYLVEYDTYKKEWMPRAAQSFELQENPDGSLDVFYTLRGNLFWSFYSTDRKIPVTSDDVVFWYNEIEGNREFKSSAYNSHFVTMPDGTQEAITIEKIDDKKFAFHFPVVFADPLLHTNTDIKPSFIYKRALERGGASAVKNLYTVASDPRTIPSCGQWFLAEYTAGQRMVFKRNGDYWKMDDKGATLPYPAEKVVQLVSDQNTQSLLFKQGKAEVYFIRPEELEDVVSSQNSDYTVYNAQGSLSAPFWSFNQNPKNSGKPYYKWFCEKKFRQAMSCLLNRERIINQAYRGLAEVKYTFFPDGNVFYNPDIILKYRYSHAQAKHLLSEAGFERKGDGYLYDKDGNKVEFDISISSSSPAYSDMAQIIMDDCASEGIKVNVRQTDFQKLVEQLTATYDWQSIMIGFGGSDLFPSQGSNVWPSDGNLHLWHPMQEKPATEWEARVDYLYNEGCHTLEYEKAKSIWDEYQAILLEECPIIFLLRSRSFCAIRNVWDQRNFYFDNMVGAKTDTVFLAQ